MNFGRVLFRSVCRKLQRPFPRGVPQPGRVSHGTGSASALRTLAPPLQRSAPAQRARLSHTQRVPPGVGSRARSNPRRLSQPAGEFIAFGTISGAEPKGGRPQGSAPLTVAGGGAQVALPRCPILRTGRKECITHNSFPLY